MKRRNFLRTLGVSALAVPVAIDAVKGIEVSKEKNLIEQAGKYEKEYTHNWIRIQESIDFEGGQEALLHWNNKTNKT